MGLTRNVVKCSIVGDGMVGKTCLARKFSGMQLPEQYVSTIMDNFTGTIAAYGQKYTVKIKDTAGQYEDYGSRDVVYKESDVCIVCYSAIDRDSLESAITFWIPEIRKKAKKISIVLLATQTELRDKGNSDHVKTEEGQKFAKDLNVDRFSEISAFKDEGVKEAFENAVKTVIMNKKCKSKWFKSMLGS